MDKGRKERESEREKVKEVMIEREEAERGER